MFMLRNPIEEYNATALNTANLTLGEQQHFSFTVTEVEKHLLGYKPQPEMQYLCHFTNSRLILEPQAHAMGAQMMSSVTSLLSPASETTLFYQIPYEAITAFQTIRSLTLAAYVRIVLKPTPTDAERELVLMASPIAKGRIENASTNCSADFAMLGNLMLQVDETFVQKVQTSSVPVLVHFWAPGCKPCDIFAPVMEQVKEQFAEQVQVLKVNMNDGPGLPIRYGVDSVPSVLIFKQGTIVDKIDGAIPGPLFTKVLQRHLQS